LKALSYFKLSRVTIVPMQFKGDT